MGRKSRGKSKGKPAPPAPGISPDLAARLSRGLSPDELADPALLGEIARGVSGMPSSSVMSFSQDSPPPRSALVSPGDVAEVSAGMKQPGAIPGKIVLGGDRTDGEPALPSGLQPGDVIAREQPLGFTETGITLPEGGEIAPGSRVWRASPEDLPGWRERAAELDQRGRRLIAGGVSQDGPPGTEADARAIRLRTNWTADDVLSQHAWLTHHYRQPSDDLADYLAHVMRDCIRQNNGTAVMFWPVDLSAGPADLPQGRELARLLSRGLGDGRTFQVTAPMVARMRETRDGLTGHINILDEGELPCAAGFAWLDAPWLMRISAGYWLPVRAVSWERTTILASDRGLAVSRDAARIVLWLAIADDVAFGRWDSEQRAGKVANQVGRLVTQHVAILPFGTELNIPAKLRDNGTSLLGLLHALWLYLGMTLPKSRPVRASSPAIARRARASLRHDEVHIVTLREYDYISDDPPAGFPGKINWTCRWWVDEFCRHIDHYDDTDEQGRRRRHQAIPAGRTGYVTDDDHDICGVCLARGQAVRIARVRSFAKGPADKPFRTPAPERTVYKLAR